MSRVMQGGIRTVAAIAALACPVALSACGEEEGDGGPAAKPKLGTSKIERSLGNALAQYGGEKVVCPPRVDKVEGTRFECSAGARRRSDPETGRPRPFAVTLLDSQGKRFSYKGRFESAGMRRLGIEGVAVKGTVTVGGKSRTTAEFDYK